RLIDTVRRRWGDLEAARLLPDCGPDLAAALVDTLAPAVSNWRALGRRHPGLVLDHAERALAGLPPSQWPAWWLRHQGGVAAAIPHHPQRVITLLERHWTAGPMPQAMVKPCGLLLDADVPRMLELLLAPDRRPAAGQWLGRRAVRRRLAGLTDADLGRVGRAVRENERLLLTLLSAVAPRRRPDLYDAAMAGFDRGRAEVSDQILEVLPAARRAAEAGRMLGLRHVRDHPDRVMAITAFLPYDEAEPTLALRTRARDAGERADGYRLLISCAGRSRDPEVLTRLLESLTRFRNEQDPVRDKAAAALAAVPPSLFREVHLPALDQMIDDALAARDCSHQTRYTFTRIAARVFEQGALREEQQLVEFALGCFERLTGHLGTIHLGRLHRVLRRGRERELVARLAPHLEREAARDQHQLAFALAEALEHRGHDLPELQEALRRAVSARLDSISRRAIRLWLAAPGTRDDRAGRLVADDPSTVVIAEVMAILARRRTDLLGVVLGGRAPTGRFLMEGVRYVPTVWRGDLVRWTATQRTAYLRLMRRAADDASASKVDRAGAVRAIGQIPGLSHDRLGRYVRSPDPLLRRAGLTSSAWTARPADVLPDLLAHASGDDAHVAVYAATRAARFVRPSALGALLAPVLADGKVTARKEAVRLLAVHRVPGAADLLTGLWAQDGLHHDVRAAVVSAALRMLDEPRMWGLLREAVTGPPDVARAVIGGAPLDLPAPWRRPYADLVVEATRSPDPRVRSAAVHALMAWGSYAPEASERLAGLVADLGASADWRAAVEGLVIGAFSGHTRRSDGPGGSGGSGDWGSAGDALREAIERLATAPEGPDAEPERDRPAAQRLELITARVASLAGVNRAAAGPVIEMAATALPLPLAARLRAATVRWDEPGTALPAPLPPGVLAVVDVGRALAGSTGRVEPERVLPHAERLAALGEEAAGLLAVALTDACGARAGWPPPWRDLLRRLRAHAAPDVAYAARGIRTAAE
ncbi:hypothetical protein, partial [Actinomadura sp. HBU206391]|uniref:hypothetical protein n=1 Tax=Actinomadura sp. HBU206391 TaxID=2731692 RepID=UPI0016507F57